jgi:hypothetical protein
MHFPNLLEEYFHEAHCTQHELDINAYSPQLKAQL